MPIFYFRINKNAAEVVIRERLSGVNFNKEQLGGAIQDKKSENSSIVENINVLEPKLDQLSRNQENLVRLVNSKEFQH